jgi:hypothetical protein
MPLNSPYCGEPVVGFRRPELEFTYHTGTAKKMFRHGEPVQLLSESATGWTVQLPGWIYLVVVKFDSGEARYDNYNGSWGIPRSLTSCYRPMPSRKPSSKPGALATALRRNCSPMARSA